MKDPMNQQEKQAAYDAWFVAEVDKGLADLDAGCVLDNSEASADMELFLQSLRKKTVRQLEWSKRSIADRKKIARFYNEEASFFIAQEADRAIVEAALRILRRPLAYRDGKRSGRRRGDSSVSGWHVEIFEVQN